MSSSRSPWLWQLHSTTVLDLGRKKVELQQYAALRGQNTGARAREEVVHDAHEAPRGQKTPPTGVRPGRLVDPGSQRSDRSLRRSAGDCRPSPAVLAGSAGEVVDSSSLRFLTAAALRQRKEEEEKVEREAKAQEKKVAESEVQQQAAAALEQARLLLERNKRKRKKRRKRRTPRTSPRSSRGRASTTAVAFPKLTQCPLRLLAGPRCWTSWTVWTR